MRNGKRYIKKSADGRFFLYIEKPEYSIDPDKKTKLWLSSNYLVEESLKDDREKTIEILEHLIKWNEKNQNFESCSSLLSLRNKI